jgi:hypothetical protein
MAIRLETNYSELESSSTEKTQNLPPTESSSTA